MGPRDAAWLRPATGFGDQFACFRRSRNEERSDLRLGCHELRPKEKRKDCRANNSFKPTPFRCVACVRSLRSHTSPHRSRRGLTQAVCGGHEELLCAGKAAINRVPNVDHAVILDLPALDLRAIASRQSGSLAPTFRGSALGDRSIPSLAGVRSPQSRRLTYSSWRITTHSSRRRFAARLSSSVRPAQWNRRDASKGHSTSGYLAESQSARDFQAEVE